MNEKFKDYYKLLGVTPRASFENIRSAAEHQLSQNWNNALGRLEIQEAYEVLSDPEKRKEYDEEFNRRLSEREIAIRNARTFEEYIAATSLHSELANVDMAPEVEVPQEEIDKLENSNVNNEDVSQTSESVEEKEQYESTVDSSTGSDYNESSSESTETPQENENIQENEDVQENETEQEQELEEAKEEQQEENLEEEQLEENLEEEQLEEEQETKVSETERQFINIPIERLEKENEPQQLTEPTLESKENLENEPLISKNAVRGLIKAALIAGGVGLGCLIIGPSVIGGTLGLMAGVAVGDFYKKHADKIKLQRKPIVENSSKTVEIKEINTEETQFLNQCAEKLENQIYDLLDKPSKNYELEIAIRKYENLIEITEKRIEFKESEKVNCVLKKLEVKALDSELKKLKHKLKKLNNTLEQLKNKREFQIDKKDPRLSRLNQKLSDISYQTSAIENDQLEEKMTEEQKEEKLEDLSEKKSRLLEKRDAKANRLYVNKDLISFGQVTLVKLNSAINIVKSVAHKFPDLNEEEQLEESSAKSM